MEHYKNLFVTVVITITIYLILFLTFNPIEKGSLELHIFIVAVVIILGILTYIILHRSSRNEDDNLQA